MKVYGAVANNCMDFLSEEDLSQLYLLFSIVSYGKDKLRGARLCKESIIDSGAFTYLANNRSENINWEEYIEKYADIINKVKPSHYIELDIDPIIGYDEVKRLRKILEDKTGKQAIRVWHKSRGKNEWLKDVHECYYCAVGGIVTKEWKEKEFPLMGWFINEAHKAGAKVHGLGFTRQKYFSTLPFDSVDSSMFCGSRFGNIHYFNGSKMITRGKRQGSRLCNGVEADAFSLKEFIKFQKYCEERY